MDNIIRTTPRLHPLLAAAAVSVIAVCVAGIGVMTGVIPGSHAGAAAPVAAADTTRAGAAAAPAPAQGAPAQQAAPGPAAVPRAEVTPHAAPRPAHKPRSASLAATEAPPAATEARTTQALPAATATPARLQDAIVPAGNSGGAAQADARGAEPVPPAQAAVVPPAQAAVVRPACATCGVVESIVEIEKPGEGTGLGAAGGALGGAVIGKQFGNGNGRTALTLLGAIGGALAGHQIEKQVRASKVYEVRIRMEDGSLRTLTQAGAPTWRSGDRVRVEGGALSLDS
jgi:outer membrane lipoprotein SlyB